MKAAPRDRREISRRRARQLGLDRLSVFVPALMSVGIVFWIATELRELVRARAERSRNTKSDVAAIAVADDVLGVERSIAPGLRARPVYLLIAVALLGVAAYVSIGSAANFGRDGGYVVGIAWLLALAAAASFVALSYAVASFVVYLTWPRPPAWAQGVLLRSPLGASTVSPDTESRPSWVLGALLAAAAGAAATLAALVAFSPEIIDELNTAIGDWFAQHELPGTATPLGLMGALTITTVAGLAAAVLAYRCHVLVACYVVSIGAALVSGAVLRPLVARTGEVTEHLVGDIDTFPNVPPALLVLMAGLFPLSLAVAVRRFWVVHATRVVLGVLVAVYAIRELAMGELATDVAGGVLIGLALVLTSQYVVDNQLWHGACDGCPWSAHPYEGPVRDAVPLHPSRRQVLTLAIAAATAGLSVLVLSIDAEPAVQAALIAAATCGTLTAWRWAWVATLLGAAAAVGAGVLASREHAAWLAVLLTLAFFAPYALLWISRPRGR